MDPGYKKKLIWMLDTELKAAMSIHPEDIAESIRNIGFCCLMCGRCCRSEHGDNSVMLGPVEIHRICHHTGLTPEQVAEPPEHRELQDTKELSRVADMIDRQGNVHTFGWILSRKDNGDCIFIQDRPSGNRCSAYGARPMLCSTYPFFMEDGKLQVSLCEGLGGAIGQHESFALAVNVLDRYIAELKETILTYEKFEAFERGNKNINNASSNIREGIIKYIVHDCRGSNRTTRRII